MEVFRQGPKQIEPGVLSEEEENALALAVQNNALPEAAQALDTLYNSYVDKVYHFFYERTGNEYDARTLTQETFYRVLQGLEDKKWSGQPFWRWLFEIAFKVYRKWARKKGRKLPITEAQPVHRGPDESEQ